MVRNSFVYMMVKEGNFIEKINQELPEDIRVFAIKRVNQSFNSKMICDGRVYEYFMPTYLFKKALVREEGGMTTTGSTTVTTKPMDLEQLCQTLILDEASVSSLLSHKRNLIEDDDDDDEENEEEMTPHKDTNFKKKIKNHQNVSKPLDDATGGHLSSNHQEDMKEGGEIFSFSSNQIDNLPKCPRLDELIKDDSFIEISDPPLQNLTPHKKDCHQTLPNMESREQPLPKEEEDSRPLFRISPSELDRLQKLLHHYVGSHNFHNYTSRRTFEQQSSRRVIHSFTVGSPQIFNHIEWISLTVQGQSFMLHQIRKMIGLVILMMRYGDSDQDASLISKSFEKIRWNIPRAPGVGLMLNQVLLHFYNQRFTGGRDGSLAEPIHLDDYRSLIDPFKEHQIYRRILQEELHLQVFSDWLRSLLIHVEPRPTSSSLQP